ncbi:MAG: UbiX family flavin prenyltransferase [Acidobacteriota bacterium]
METRKIVVGITGASGAIYAIRLLKALLEKDAHIDLIISGYGERILKEETGFDCRSETAIHYIRMTYGMSSRNGVTVVKHDFHDLAAPIASGSYRTEGMVVIPCSMKSLAGIAHGLSRNLIERVADVTLKEKRPLIIVPRETPLNLIHIRNMASVAEAGGIVLPAMPAFYNKPKNINDLADFIVGKIFNILKFENTLFTPWK